MTENQIYSSALLATTPTAATVWRRWSTYYSYSCLQFAANSRSLQTIDSSSSGRLHCVTTDVLFCQCRGAHVAELKPQPLFNMPEHCSFLIHHASVSFDTLHAAPGNIYSSLRKRRMHKLGISLCCSKWSSYEAQSIVFCFLFFCF